MSHPSRLLNESIGLIAKTHIIVLFKTRGEGVFIVGLDRGSVGISTRRQLLLFLPAEPLTETPKDSFPDPVRQLILLRTRDSCE